MTMDPRTRLDELLRKRPRPTLRIIPLLNFWLRESIEDPIDMGSGISLVRCHDDLTEQLVREMNNWKHWPWPIETLLARLSNYCLVQRISERRELDTLLDISFTARLLKGTRRLELFLIAYGIERDNSIKLHGSIHFDYLFLKLPEWDDHFQWRREDGRLFFGVDEKELCSVAEIERFRVYHNKLRSASSQPMATNRFCRALSTLHDSFAIPLDTYRFVTLTMVIEVLFTTDSAGLTDKLAQRIALYLGDDGAERLEIYNRVKALYGVRSAIVHGQDVKQGSRKDMKMLIDDLEDIARRTICKILDRDEHLLFSEKNQILDGFFKRLVLGA